LQGHSIAPAAANARGIDKGAAVTTAAPSLAVVRHPLTA
jgi:hypothetical protein